MGELVNRGESAIVPEGFYKQVSSILNAARDKAYTAVNFAMVEAYWEIGKSIVDEQGGEERAKYGEALIAGLSQIDLPRISEEALASQEASQYASVLSCVSNSGRTAYRIELDTLPQVDAHSRP